MTSLITDHVVLGNSISQDTRLIGYMFALQKKPWTVLMGGEFGAEKLLGIYSLLDFCDHMILVGELGILF